MTFREIAGARNAVFYNRKASPRWDREGPRSGGCEMTILSSDIVGLSSDCARIVFLLAEALQDVSAEILSFEISWQARYLVRLEGDLTAPRIGNDVSYVTQIIDDIHFAWQAQYLVRLAGDFS